MKKKFEASVTAEIFFDIEAGDHAEAMAEAMRLAGRLAQSFPTPDGSGRVGVMTYARDKGTISVREVEPSN